MHFDWQIVVTVIIVALAAVHIGRILAAQIAGLRKSARPGGSACGSCGGSHKPASQPLIALSPAPPRRMVAPTSSENPAQSDP
ncbi:MAG TPA: hypothetical protein VFW40_01435 [Capsulimonadaceae bacterium]|nr:hypothetical protein [Capsulimonadaceae bacterium]